MKTEITATDALFGQAVGQYWPYALIGCMGLMVPMVRFFGFTGLMIWVTLAFLAWLPVLRKDAHRGQDVKTGPVPGSCETDCDAETDQA